MRRMAASITGLLSDDHDRLDALLRRAEGADQGVELPSYEAFRKGLLKHVGMEEMILLPAAKSASGGAAALAAKARLDHGALTALLVPAPTPAILDAIRAVLGPHNELEERCGGLYEQCEQALGSALPGVLRALELARDIPPAAHADGPHVMAVIRRALDAAGHPEVRLPG